MKLFVLTVYAVFIYACTAQNLEAAPANGTIVNLTGSIENSDDICPSEAFFHYYVRGKDSVQAVNNTWRAAKAGRSADLTEMCLYANGLPVTRKCLRNDKRIVTWENISQWPQVYCYHDTRENIITSKLHNLHDEILQGKHLHQGVQGRRRTANLVADFIKTPNCKLLPADIDYTSKILAAIIAEGNNSDFMLNVTNVFSRLIGGDPKVLRLSAELNATNSLLDTFETYMDRLSDELISQKHCNALPKPHMIQHESDTESHDFSHLGVVAQLTAAVSVFFVNPNCANISGIAVYQNRTGATDLQHSRLGYFQYRFLYLNESTANLLLEPGLVAATFVPLELWQEISSVVQTTRKRNPVIVVKVYEKDNIFVDRKLLQTTKPFSKIMSITIPGFQGEFSTDLPFILRNSKLQASTFASPETGCGYWDYDTWITLGVQTFSNYTETDLILCGTNHLTQFGFLVGGNYKENDLSDEVLISPVSQKALDIISVLGCSLSLIGLLGIWLTSALFPKWRMLASRKVLLHLCLALTLQMTLFLFINTDNMAEHLSQNADISVACVFLGAMMQYLVLVLFMWMLSTAYLQFQRYVTVVGDHRPTHYVLKSALLAWGLPLIPTLISALVDPASYMPSELQLSTNTGVCYPSGYVLVFGVILPVAVIAVVNVVIFMYVFYSISRTLKQPSQRNEKNIMHKQIQLSILLFFILGLPWIFGLLAFIESSIVFSYLFCLTATLQGFVLFIFYVLMDELARSSWLLLFCPKRAKRLSAKTRELQSMTTASTNLRTSHQRDNGELTVASPT